MVPPIGAAEAGIAKTSVHRFLQALGLRPDRRDSFKLPTDPFFIEKLRDIVGLCLNPPRKGLERTQPLPPLGFGFVEGVVRGWGAKRRRAAPWRGAAAVVGIACLRERGTGARTRHALSQSRPGFVRFRAFPLALTPERSAAGAACSSADEARLAKCPQRLL
jgi:hypothetical protein